MLTKVGIQRYKSLHDVSIKLEPLTVLIGPNGSGKSNVCEALFVMSHMLKWRGKYEEEFVSIEPSRILEGAARLTKYQNWIDKFWRRKTDRISFSVMTELDGKDLSYTMEIPSKVPQVPDVILEAIDRVVVYHFSSALMSLEEKPTSLAPTGEGIANSLATLQQHSPDLFAELEQSFIELIPNVTKIALTEQSKFHRTYYSLQLVDKYTNQLIPATEVSDGALRVLAFLTALYQVDKPTLICFEELENGLHPWLLHRTIEILNRVVTEGVGGKRIQILLTTHSPVLLDYVESNQVRAVELDDEGNTRIHALPTQVGRLQAAMEAYDDKLEELWFTNIFGDNQA
jgi:predicted ATPase